MCDELTAIAVLLEEMKTIDDYLEKERRRAKKRYKKRKQKEMCDTEHGHDGGKQNS